MDHAKRKVEIAPQVESRQRAREIQLLLNVIEPDPERQPTLFTDEASPLHCVGASKDLIFDRLSHYFGEPFPFQLTTPLWRLVDLLKARWPAWPDDWPPDAV